MIEDFENTPRLDLVLTPNIKKVEFFSSLGLPWSNPPSVECCKNSHMIAEFPS